MEQFDTDKTELHMRVYQKWLPTKEKGTLCEVGVLRGGSLEMWSHRLPGWKIVGIDKELTPQARKLADKNPRIQLYQCDQADTATLQNIGMWHDAFDVVIDDASHIGHLTANCFRALFPYVAPGGLYFLEDYGTSYWSHWPDGWTHPQKFKTPGPGTIIYHGHHAGMVGWMKQLIDEVELADDVQCPGWSTQIAAVHFYSRIVVAEKKA